MCGRAGVRVAGGVGYLSHPSLCDHYVQCYRGADCTLTAVTRHCGPGLLWDQERARCQRASEVTCQTGLLLRLLWLLKV